MPLELNSLNLGDCLELMQEIPDQSIDMVLADLPYGSTACAWDSVINLNDIWLSYKKIIKKNGAIVLTANHPFTSILVSSNLEMFKYCWVWDKVRGYNFSTVNIRPFNAHEDVCVFYKKQPIFNPQMLKGEPYTQKQGYVGEAKQTGLHKKNVVTVNNGTRYPLSIITFAKKNLGLHPTQKPPDLFEYLIRTYTNEGDVVLDNTAGVYTTAIAAINTNRQYICIEKDPGYHALGSEWVRLVKGGMQWKEALKQVKKNKSAILDEVAHNS